MKERFAESSRDLVFVIDRGRAVTRLNKEFFSLVLLSLVVVMAVVLLLRGKWGEEIPWMAETSCVSGITPGEGRMSSPGEGGRKRELEQGDKEGDERGEEIGSGRRRLSFRGGVRGEEGGVFAVGCF